MSKVARDLQKMFARQENDSILKNLQNNDDFQEITKKNYLKNFEKEKENFLNSYEKTQTVLYDLGEYLNNNDILSGLKAITDVTTFLIPGKIDNLLADIINAPTDLIINSYQKNLENYEKAYDHFFDLMANNIEKVQSIGESIRNEVFYYHIGVEDKNQKLSIFQLDSKTMAQFEKDKELFKLSVDKKENITFKLQENLTGEDVIEGINRAIKEVGNPKQHKNLMYNLADSQQNDWHELRNTKLKSQTADGQRTNKNVRGAGRRFEIFDEILLSSQKDFATELTTMKKEGHYLDNLSWTAGGDLSGKIGEQNIGIQNKMFSYNKWYDWKTKTNMEGYSQYGFSISSYDSLVEGIKFYKNTKDAISKDSEGNWIISKDSDFWSAIDDIRQSDNTYSEENIDMVLEETIAEEAEAELSE